MLQMRLAGDPQEIAAFLARLTATGVEVAPGTVKSRGEFSHGYSTVRMPDWSTDSVAQEPIRVEATVGQALAPTTRRPPARRRLR